MITIKINGEEKLFEDGVQYELIAEESATAPLIPPTPTSAKL